MSAIQCLHSFLGPVPGTSHDRLGQCGYGMTMAHPTPPRTPTYVMTSPGCLIVASCRRVSTLAMMSSRLPPSGCIILDRREGAGTLAVLPGPSSG